MKIVNGNRIEAPSTTVVVLISDEETDLHYLTAGHRGGSPIIRRARAMVPATMNCQIMSGYDHPVYFGPGAQTPPAARIVRGSRKGRRSARKRAKRANG